MSDLTDKELMHLFGTTSSVELKSRKDLMHSKYGRTPDHKCMSTYSLRTPLQLVSINEVNLSPDKKDLLRQYRRMQSHE